MTHRRLSSHFRRWKPFINLTLMGAMLTGCNHGNEKKLSYLGGEKDLQFYEDAATRIQFPNVEEPTPENVAYSQKPRLVGDHSREEIWEMPLTEAIHLALKNNKILRTRGEFLSPSNGVYTNVDNVTSVYDTAIRESGVLFGGRGVESALSQFDTTFTTNLLYNQNSVIQNNAFLSGALQPGSVIDTGTGTFAAGLAKNFGYGANMNVTQNWTYLDSNQNALLLPSSFSGNLGFNYTQPLWSGSGAEFTRIAGPLNTNLQGLSGVNQGVIIARINTDITLVDFEAQVRNMLKDVEDIYWELYLAYRSYDSTVVARNSALRTWREVYAKFVIGAKGGGAADEAQSREAYFDARSRAEDALQNLYSFELQLRRLCGLPSHDGRTIRPADEPTTAEFVPEWHISLAEALTRREELRRQKWNIKSLDLQLAAARNLANPQLNLVASYQLNGFGKELFGSPQTLPPTAPFGTGAPTPVNQQAGNSAYSNLFAGNQNGYSAGFQFNLPIGLRNAKAQVRNLELRLAKSRDVLASQELEVSAELANAFQNIAWRHATAQTNFNRRRAAEVQLQSFEAEYKAGTKTLDLLLQAQSRLSAAEIAYYTSVIRYNQAITDAHFRKGTLLENNNVHLEEGMWTPEAYKDALRRAWARTYSADALAIDPLKTEPEPFASDAITGSATFAVPEGPDGTMLPPPAAEAPQVPGVDAPLPEETPLGAEPQPAPPAAPLEPTPETP